jgi:hypothetical protein
MTERQTERIVDETGVGDPLAESDPKEPGKLADQIEPDDATPEEGVERPDPPEPDPDHVVEEKQQSD